MKYLLFLGRTERQLWSKDGRGWQRVSGEPKGPVWIVTDLAEESLGEIKTPRLFGRDRSSYIARLLATRYPDTPYRACITPAQEGDLLGKIAPTRYILFGIDAAERLNAELDEASYPVAGVWPASMLLALLGQERELPADLFVVLPGPGTLRIVFLKNRTPVLTRLTLTPNQASAQVEEIVRTLKHLENTQAVPRGRQDYSVLLLADPVEFEGPMAAARLKLVSLRRWEKTPPGDWHFPLFDLALRSPTGQLAPLERRVDFLSTRLNKAAMVLAAVIAVAGLGAVSNNLLSIVGMLGESRALAASIQNIDTRISELEANIGRFGVAPDTVRRAVALHDEEIASVPAMDQHLRQISGVLAGDPNLRLTQLQWRLLAPAAVPCGVSRPEGGGGGEAAQPENQQRKVEITFELAVPAMYGPRDRAQTLRTISRRLAAMEGLVLWRDANTELASGSLRGGTDVGAAKNLVWCLTLPGTLPVAKESAGAATS
ncbi:MAG: hypothetical protein Q8M11_03265 [Sulfuritalea sp.]|nr:hypothetical protein [Sulfuritalea sp.]MDP1984588.1 hypothetical protein [Sulfuritalea sp.]